MLLSCLNSLSFATYRLEQNCTHYSKKLSSFVRAVVFMSHSTGDLSICAVDGYIPFPVGQVVRRGDGSSDPCNVIQDTKMPGWNVFDRR